MLPYMNFKSCVTWKGYCKSSYMILYQLHCNSCSLQHHVIFTDQASNKGWCNIATTDWATMIGNWLRFHTDIQEKRFSNIKEDLTVNDTGETYSSEKPYCHPNTLRKQTLALAYEGHQGILRTKLIREKLWFLKPDHEIEDCSYK